MISEDLALSSRTRGVVEALIESGGGNMATDVHQVDIFVCHFREGADYIYACQTGIDVGNLSWLYYIITHNEWTSPMRRLLHYPLPRNGVPGLEDCRITLSNYGGEARIYLENLVLAAGGTFTKSMKPDNTHLITARKTGEKCDAADGWDLNTINHIWLEESYAKCKVQSLTRPQYTHFPPRTHLGEVIGQTQFDAAKLEELYFPRGPGQNASPRVGRRVVQEKDRNLSDSRVSSRKESSEIVEEESDRTKAVVNIAARPKVPKARVSQNSTPIQPKRASIGKENDAPSSTGSRSAKAKAVSKLHNMASDMALYEREKKRKGNVWGGDRAANEMEKQLAEQRRSSVDARSLTPADEDISESAEEEDEPLPKRQRTSLPPIKMQLLITGYKGWLGNASKEDAGTVCFTLRRPHLAIR